MEEIKLPGLIGTVIRYVLAALGAFAVSKGWFTEVSWEAFAGAAVTVVATVWGVYTQFQAREKIKTAAAADPGHVALK